MLSSRLAVKDIGRWQDSAAPVIDVERLSDEAGAALLRDNGVWGTDQELKAAAYDFGGHPLALGLLASFLTETQSGDIRWRDHIRAFFADPDNPRHDHAKRVMESYEKEWLVAKPALHAIMHIVGLAFDRPASDDCLKSFAHSRLLKDLPITSSSSTAASGSAPHVCARSDFFASRRRWRPPPSTPILWSASGSASASLRTNESA